MVLPVKKKEITLLSKSGMKNLSIDMVVVIFCNYKLK